MHQSQYNQGATMETSAQEKMEQAIREAAEAFARGAAEADSDFTWADPARPADGSLTALDEAYDHGRTWAENHLMKG